MAKSKIGLGRKWTDDEIKLLKKLYAEKPTEELAKQLGRSLPTVRGRAHMLGLKRKRQYEGCWKPEDITFLKELYPECPIPEIAKRLGRPEDTVKHQAYSLGLKRKSYLETLWTAEELQMLRELYSTHEDIEDIAERIGRSPSTVRAKADGLGLGKRHRTYDL